MQRANLGVVIGNVAGQLEQRSGSIRGPTRGGGFAALGGTDCDGERVPPVGKETSDQLLLHMSHDGAADSAAGPGRRPRAERGHHSPSEDGDQQHHHDIPFGAGPVNHHLDDRAECGPAHHGSYGRTRQRVRRDAGGGSGHLGLGPKPPSGEVG